ncbi:hypothetical protein SSX86_025403 [Deinandra increscens subsp. villosa]|uniref:Helitron helicase-like domain-containing protein n=1 Tax=Deinandra increscens subsp. villosa TaxID=3103831 RepID=A0AAP0CD91_9ASTR
MTSSTSTDVDIISAQRNRGGLSIESLGVDILSSEIFTRVPAKAVGRCRCVCKDWLLMLSTVIFVRNHCQQMSAFDNQKVLRIHAQGFSVSGFIPRVDGDVDVTLIGSFPFTTRPSFNVSLLACLDGLVCASVRYTCDLFLWNPVTTAYKMISNSRLEGMYDHCSDAIGFYFHSSFGYRVLHVKRRRNLLGMYIYSLREDSWRSIPFLEGRMFDEPAYEWSAGVLSGDFVYFTVCGRDVGGYNGIVGFNVHSELFVEHQFPPISSDVLCRGNITSVKNELHLYPMDAVRIVESFSYVVKEEVRYSMVARQRMAAIVPQLFVRQFSSVASVGGVFALLYFTVTTFCKDEFPTYYGYILACSDKRIVIDDRSQIRPLLDDVSPSFPLFAWVPTIEHIKHDRRRFKLIIDVVGQIVDGYRLPYGPSFKVRLRDATGHDIEMTVYYSSTIILPVRFFRAMLQKSVIHVSRVKLVHLPSHFSFTMDSSNNDDSTGGEQRLPSVTSSLTPSSSVYNETPLSHSLSSHPAPYRQNSFVTQSDGSSFRRRPGKEVMGSCDLNNVIRDQPHMVPGTSSAIPSTSNVDITQQPTRSPVCRSALRGRLSSFPNSGGVSSSGQRNRTSSSIPTTSNVDVTHQTPRRPVGRPPLRGRPSSFPNRVSVGPLGERNDVCGGSTFRRSVLIGNMPTYWDCGDADCECTHCKALCWYGERTIKALRPLHPKFSLCCGEGKVILPLLRDPPQPLSELLNSSGDQRSRVFKKNIKVLNAMFAFTSTGGNVIRDCEDGGGPFTFCLNGINHHKIGTLLPTHDDGRPRFAQLYVYDTSNEADNRISALRHCIPRNTNEVVLRSLVDDLIMMLNANNALVQAFRMARERFNDSDRHPVKIRLIGSRNSHGSQYNLPTAYEVAALIPGDSEAMDSRDILIQERDTYTVKRVSELHPSFMALQYPLLFPYGEDGFHLKIPLRNSNSPNGRKTVTLREYYCFRLHIRRCEGKTLHRGGRLFHTYVVDAYAAVLNNSLEWYRQNQTSIRSDLYCGLQDRMYDVDSSCANIGRRVILPSSFTGGPRHMIQQYQDAMAVCRWAGPPDLFITMTCNPNWPEITRHVQRHTPGELNCNQPHIISRVFKIKLDELINDIRRKYHFGQPKAVIYTIEFQKRGLPHCHSILFLNPADKLNTPESIDKFISADLPSEETDPCAFAAVRAHMIHGPCGQLNPRSPCMENGVCSKGYPKPSCEMTYIKDDGWPVYRRPLNRRKTRVGPQNIEIDNKFVVPHNIDFVVKYGCHVNVEWCNQGTLVKYLFNYINKGPDRATFVMEGQNQRTSFASLLQHDNEIEQYLNCRYISASEACWRLFAFDVHYRSVAVERLPFHEEGRNRVYFRDDDEIGSVAQRRTAAMSKFTGWLQANRLYPEGRCLTYRDYPTMFTWHDKEREWRPRKSGFSIGRIYFVCPSMGERYYLRMLLNHVRGPLSFEDIRTVDGVVHPTYRSACKALNLLGDDIEWVESIREASQWKLGNQLRQLFATILMFCTVTDYAQFFSECLPFLSEDIIRRQHNLLQNENVEFLPEEIVAYTLIELDKILISNGRSLDEFPDLPRVDPRLCNRISNSFLSL